MPINKNTMAFNPWDWESENWGGDPEGKLAKALESARKKNKGRNPLKIEKLPTVRTLSGDLHIPRELVKDKDITPEEMANRTKVEAESFDAEPKKLYHGRCSKCSADGRTEGPLYRRGRKTLCIDCMGEYFGAESFEADMTKQGKDFVSKKIATIMRDWKKTGKIGNSTPKDAKAAQQQAIAISFSMAARKGFKGTKKNAESFEAEDKGNTRTFQITSVDYDTYDEEAEEQQTQDELDLPQEMTITVPSSDVDWCKDYQDYADEIVDEVSDRTGWLVQGFSFHEVLDGGGIREFDADPNDDGWHKRTDPTNPKRFYYSKGNLADYTEEDIKHGAYGRRLGGSGDYNERLNFKGRCWNNGGNRPPIIDLPKELWEDFTQNSEAPICDENKITIDDYIPKRVEGFQDTILFYIGESAEIMYAHPVAIKKGLIKRRILPNSKNPKSIIDPEGISISDIEMILGGDWDGRYYLFEEGGTFVGGENHYFSADDYDVDARDIWTPEREVIEQIKYDSKLKDIFSLIDKDSYWDSTKINEWTPERQTIEEIRGNREYREMFPMLGKHPGHYDDSGWWVEYHDEYNEDYSIPQLPIWCQILLVCGVSIGIGFLAKKLDNSQ